MDKNLLFRRQFILSSNPEHTFENWIRLNLDKDLFLSVHPDLGVVQSTAGEILLTMLGFAINPFKPEKTNQEILNDLITEKDLTFEAIIRETEPLGGRWIIIFKDKKTLKIFNDPCANRSVYYHTNATGILCGSDPAILNHFVKLEKDNSADILAVLNNPGYKLKEKAWAGPTTIFKNINHLMPNFFLDVRQNTVTRYWPYKPIEKMNINKAVDICSEIMKGSITGISKRQKVVLAVTAGWDSRVLLAASKEIQHEATYFVSVKGTEKENFHEVVVPKRLFEKKLRLPFYVQKCNFEIEKEFKKTMETNVSMSRTYLQKAKNIYKYKLDFEGMINVNGNVSEIGRLCIRPIIPVKVTGEKLVELNYYDYGGKYFVKEFDLWINGIKDYCKKFNLNIYDMLYWEQRMGNWGSLYPAELDIAMDQFSPFNNRLLLTTMLSVDEKYRKYPHYKLHYKMIQKLWPETLYEPVGVMPFKTHVKKNIKHFISDIIGLIPVSEI